MTQMTQTSIPGPQVTQMTRMDVPERRNSKAAKLVLE